MADIKQAAEWIRRGKKVVRSPFDKSGYYYGSYMGFFMYKSLDINDTRDYHDVLGWQDIIADDWEIYDE